MSSKCQSERLPQLRTHRVEGLRYFLFDIIHLSGWHEAVKVKMAVMVVMAVVGGWWLVVVVVMVVIVMMMAAIMVVVML